MKELTVIIGPRGNQQTVTVQLNGVLPDAKLTPQLARQAARVAQGGSWGATVWDWEDEYNGIGYRLYKNTHRKLECIDGETFTKS